MSSMRYRRLQRGPRIKRFIYFFSILCFIAFGFLTWVSYQYIFQCSIPVGPQEEEVRPGPIGALLGRAAPSIGISLSGGQLLVGFGPGVAEGSVLFIESGPYPWSILELLKTPDCDWNRSGNGYYVVTVPVAWLVCLCGLFAFFLRRYRHLSPPGCCEGCGFDLFRNPESHCPECGLKTAIDAPTREKDCGDWLACPVCLTAVLPPATGPCAICAHELNPETLVHEAFHSHRDMRLFSGNSTYHSFEFARRFFLALRPLSFWRMSVINRPISIRHCVAFWGISAIIYGVVTVTLMRYSDQSEPWSISLLVTTIGLLLPPACCFALSSLRQSISRIPDAASTILLAYAYSMPTFAWLWLLSIWVVYSQIFGENLSVLAPAAGYLLWTILLRRSMGALGPIRQLRRAMIFMHAIVPIGILNLYFAVMLQIHEWIG